MKSIFSTTVLVFIVFLSGSTVFGQSTREDSLREFQRKLDVLTEEIERMKLGEVAEPRYESVGGLGPAASKVYSLKKTGVSLAGYGEVVYENYAKNRDDGTASGKVDQFDYLRNVLYVGFRFNDWILFNSEVEFEHGSTGKGGEVSVEFGYVEMMLSKNLNLRAGMVLSPLGISNEKHEPTTFFGSLRPLTERSVIPTTWRANGIGAYGDLGVGLSYRVYVIEGLNAKYFSDGDGIRGGRQSGAKALADDLGITGKIEYSGLAEGPVLGASFYAGNSGQSATDSLGEISAGTSVVSVHGEQTYKGLEVRALYAAVNVDQAGRVSKLAGKTVGSKMNGWYVSAGYDVMPVFKPGTEHYLAPFVRYERVNTQASVDNGFTANRATDRTVLTAGLTYKPHPNVGFKIDYNDIKNEAGTGINQSNLAVNYLF